jgi:hypothetical protein
MNKQLRLMAMLTTALVLATTAWAKDEDNPNAKTAKTPPNAPEGWIVLEEDFWVPLAHEPGMFFHRAHEEYLEQEYELAAVDLRQAAAFLRLQARRSTYAEDSSAVYAAANHLFHLAGGIEEGAVKSIAQLDRAFARAHYALAEHDYAMAQESWGAKHPYMTGLNLNAAVFNLESGYSWANAELDKSGLSAVADARVLADELIAGRPAKTEVTATLDAVHAAINGLSRRVTALPQDAGLALDEPAVVVAPVIGPGWVLVEEDIWTDLPDSAGRHLHNAYEAYLQRSLERTATQIRKAVFDLELQAGRATGDDRAALMDAIHDLEGLLAPHDHTRAIVDLPRERYDRAIAGACYALARHHCEMAEADWAADLKTTAGYDLRWAANYLDRGRAWTNQVNDPNAENRLRDARRLSDALIAGKAGDEKNVAQRIASLEQEVVALRTAIVTMAQ